MQTTTYDQERLEMIDAVLQTLAAGPCPERAGVCFDLLEHLDWATIASSVTRSRYVS